MKKVLFISYFFHPSKAVGAYRNTYWAQNIKKQRESIVCDVITAMPQYDIPPNGIDNIYYVKNTQKSLIFKRFIKDEGLTWKKDLKDYIFNSNFNFNYDTVIISGSPFMHFDLTSKIKKVFNCRVILDFRDPFANNPRFGDQGIKYYIKSLYERKFISNADAILSVNEYCLSLLRGKKEDAKFFVIENGYDENIVNEILEKEEENICLTKGDNIRLVYAGSFYEDRDPSNLLEILTSGKFNNFEFNHVGKESSYLEKHKSHQNIIQFGLQNYKTALKSINLCDVGVIITSGKNFESTTKVFDYIGLKKAILIITSGDVKSGNLYEITKDFSNVFWCKNNKIDIENTLEIISKSPLKMESKKQKEFSRKEGLKNLINLIEHLEVKEC